MPKRAPLSLRRPGLPPSKAEGLVQRGGKQTGEEITPYILYMLHATEVVVYLFVWVPSVSQSLISAGYIWSRLVLMYFTARKKVTLKPSSQPGRTQIPAPIH